MYKILLLVRDSVTQQLWEMYKTKEITEGVEKDIEFETDDENVLESVMDELGYKYPQRIILPICVLEHKWNVDVVGHI